MKIHTSTSFIRWLKGDYPLWVTCWVTGVIPYMAILQIHLSILIAFSHKKIQTNTFLLLTQIDEICFLIFIPLCLLAIANGAIKYKGFDLWRFFTFLLFAKGGEIYFNFLMGHWSISKMPVAIFN